MEQYTPKERAEIIQLYIQNNFSIVKTQRAFRNKNNVKSAPSKSTLQRLYAKFINHGSLSNTSRASRQRTRRSDENIEAVQASIEDSPRTSSYRRSQELGIARTTVFDPVPVTKQSEEETDKEEFIEEYEEEIIEPGEKQVKTIEIVQKFPQKFQEEVTITTEKKSQKKIKKSMMISN